MISADQSHLYLAATSHQGMKRKNNEDRYAVSAYRLSAENPAPSVFAIVADGIGGHHAGEVAAEIVVQEISQSVANSDAAQPLETLSTAIIEASQHIRQQAEENNRQRGMGATCACAWIIEERLFIANVGDTRIYLLREGVIRQISTDHTWIQDALQAGIISPAEVSGHPNAHVIRRYLGSPKPVEPDLRLHLDPQESDEQALANQGLPLLPGDQVLLCTDGLTDLVEDAEINTLLKDKKQDQALEQLVNLANQRGGHDNITIVLLETPLNAGSIPSTAQPRRGFKLKWPCLFNMALLIILAAILILSAVVYFYLNYEQPPSASPTPTRTPTATPLLWETPAQHTQPPTQATGQPAEADNTLVPATLTPWPTNTPRP